MHWESLTKSILPILVPEKYWWNNLELHHNEQGNSHVLTIVYWNIILLMIGIISRKITNKVVKELSYFYWKKKCYTLFSLLKSSHWIHDLSNYTCSQIKKYYTKPVTIKIWIFKLKFDMLKTLGLMDLLNWNTNTSTVNISQKLNCFWNCKHNKKPCDEKLIWNSYNMHKWKSMNNPILLIRENWFYFFSQAKRGRHVLLWERQHKIKSQKNMKVTVT